MRRRKQNINQIHLGYWWHFFLTFIFGVLLVVGFSYLVTLTKTDLQTKVWIFPWGQAFNFYVYPIYLSLTIAGALGGLLYSILLDGSLELPGWGKDGKSLNVGSIGEIFVGIGGAFTTYIFIPQELKNGPDNEIIIFVFGLVGGYGGKAILNAALSKITDRIEEADLVKEQKEQLDQQLSDQNNLLTLVTKQLEQGLSASESYQLPELIQNAPEELKQRVFTRTKEIRSLSWRTKTARDKIPLTIPIFQALVDSDPKNYEYKVQLAYSYKDSEPPRLDESISLFDEAIKLRGDRIVGNTWKYELNRALARIMQEQQQTTDSSPWKEQILADLLIVDRNYGLAKVLLESEDEVVDIPLKDWLVKNQEWIKQNSGGTDLLQKAFNVVLGATPQSSGQSSGVTESGVLVGTAGSRPSINDLKTSISSYVSTRSLRNGRSSTPIIETDHLKVAPPNTKIKAKIKTYLKKHPIDSSKLPNNQKTEVPAGKEYKVLKYSEEIDNHYLVELDYGLGIWYLWSDHWDLPWEEQRKALSSVQGSAITKTTAMPSSSHQGHDIVTRQQAQAVYGRPLTDQQFKDLNDCLNRFEINTVQRVRHFLSQTAHESGGLQYMTEIWGPSQVPAQRKYDPPYPKAKELGNTKIGDGKKYRGGGVIQLTGKHNYQEFAKFINDPKVMDGADYVGANYPFSSAGVWWKNNNMNALCDRGGTVREVTKKVNGGYYGLADRQRYYDKACQVIKQISAHSFVAQDIPMQRITAMKDTVLKKQNQQSSQLPDDQKRAVAKGQSYDVEAYKDVGGGNCWVRLASGAGEWYIFDSDEDDNWDTSWEGDEKDTDTPVNPGQGVGEIHNTPGSIDWSNGSLKISKYFTVGEVTKNDPRRRPQTNSAEEKNILALAKELDKIREDFGSPIRVTSWLRPIAVNRQIGGASNSQHIYGRGVDIQPIQGDIHKFQTWLDANWYGALGWGAKKGFVHLDTRNGKGWKTGGDKGVRWPY